MGSCQTPPDLLTPSPPWPPAVRDTARFNWLRKLVDWQKDDGSQDSSNYLASIKDDLFDEEVFVFTPNGDAAGLHKVSRAVDFAYRIHCEIGNHCHGVRINDRLCPLATSLSTWFDWTFMDLRPKMVDRSCKPQVVASTRKRMIGRNDQPGCGEIAGRVHWLRSIYCRMNWDYGMHWSPRFPGLLAYLSCLGALSVTAMSLPARAIEVVQVKFPFDLGTFTVKVSELANSKALLNGTSDLAELDRATDGKIGQLLAKAFLTPLPLSKATFQGGGGIAIVDQVIAGLAALGQLQGLTSQQQSQQEFKAAIERAVEAGPVTLSSILQQLPGQSASFDLDKMLANMQRNVGLMRVANQLVASLPPATTDPQLQKPGPLPIASRRPQLVVTHRQAPVEVEVIAPTRNPNGKLVVISHGLWDSPNSFWGWAEHLASHGYTVILPVHQGSDKGQQAAMLDGSAPPPSPAELRLRPQDVKSILDAVADGRLAGFQGIDTKNVVAIGHSWGGVTAGQLAGMRANGDLLRLRCPNRNDPDESISWVLQCSFVNSIADFNISDSRVKAIIVVSPPIGLIADPRIGQGGLHARILLISGTRDFVVPPDPEAIGPFGMAPADGHHLVLAKGGDHFNLRAPKGEKSVAVLSPLILAWVNGAFAAGASVAPGPNAPDLLPAKGWGSPSMVLVDVPREQAKR